MVAPLVRRHRDTTRTRLGDTGHAPLAAVAIARSILVLLVVSLSVLSSAIVSARQTPMVAARPAPLASTEADAAGRIRVEALRKDVEGLTAPEMQGRGTGQPGGDRAADYIAARYREIGLKPLGDDGSYKQAIRFTWERLTRDSQIIVGDSRLIAGRDFAVSPPFTFERLRATGEIVFVGYGVQSKELRRFDLSDLDLSQKFVVLLSGQPPGVSAEAWERATAPRVRLRNLLERGAAGIIVLGAGSERQPFSELADYYGRRRVDLASAERPPDGLPPIILMGETGANSLMKAAGASYRDYRAAAETGSQASAALGRTLTIDFSSERGTGIAHNCVGVLEGRDPELRGEAVALMAHYDAYGIEADGTVYPGAADNALGVAEILSVAKALADIPEGTKRSVVFLAFTGEEYGGLGSQYWIQHPTWPISRLVAALNFDGIGTEIYGPVRKIVGHGSEHSTLGSRLRDVAGAAGLSIAPDPMPEEESFYRSDHLFFAQNGVPALMLQGVPEGDPSTWRSKARKWIANDYHRPSDVVRDDWDWSGARTLASIGVILTIRLAADSANARANWFDSSPFHPTRRSNSVP